MQLTLTIPDTLASQFSAAGEDLSRTALEALAVNSYRMQKLSENEVREMLGYATRMQVHALLKEHGVDLNFSAEDLQHDIQMSNRLFERASQSKDVSKGRR